jgi:hypothetical protein
MVNTFCGNNKDCHDLPEIQDIIIRFERLLGNRCMATGQDEEDRVILSLKGLRNIGQLHRGETVVEQCYGEFTNSMYIRLAALDTIRVVACNSQHDFNTKLMSTFSNSGMDSEFRIGAYLALMSCPSLSTVDLVKNVLMTEPVNQVGSFVWTHLTNIQESQSLSPNKKDLKALVGSDFLQNKWKTDVRKFSRYFETSYYSNEFKVRTR